MSKFTKGPWQVISTSSEGYNLIKDYSGQQIADVWRFVPTRPEAIANANLIASAPDLYLALEACRDDLIHASIAALKSGNNTLHDEYTKRIFIASEALKKARGEV